MLVALNMSAEERTLPLDAVTKARAAVRLRLSSRQRVGLGVDQKGLGLAPFEAVVLELPAR